jgi:hypothetical protein
VSFLSLVVKTGVFWVSFSSENIKVRSVLNVINLDF